MTSPDWERLRKELRSSVDEAIDRFIAEQNEGGEVVTVQAEDEVLDHWTYTWPDRYTEEYDQARWYRATGPSGNARVLLARTTRTVRGDDLRRWIVFAQIGGEDSKTFYPWSEFVATDEGDFAAIIPNPQRPRAVLSDGDPLPTRFARARVERTDALYGKVADGPSLRFVVSEDDADEMIRHGYWVAELRHRIQG